MNDGEYGQFDFTFGEEDDDGGLSPREFNNDDIAAIIANEETSDSPVSAEPDDESVDISASEFFPGLTDDGNQSQSASIGDPNPADSGFDFDLGDIGGASADTTHDSSYSGGEGSSGWRKLAIFVSVFVLVVVGTIVFTKFTGGNGSTEQETTASPGTSISQEVEGNGDSAKDDYPSSATDVTGPGSHDTPIDTIAGYLNSMYVKKDVGAVFSFLDPETSYNREDTAETINSNKENWEGVQYSANITQKEEGSFTWNVQISLKSPKGRINQFAQEFRVVRIDGKWYVSTIRNKD